MGRYRYIDWKKETEKEAEELERRHRRLQMKSLKYDGFGYVLPKHEWKEVYVGEISRDLTSRGFNRWFLNAIKSGELTPVYGEGTTIQPYRKTQIPEFMKVRM